MIVEAILLEFLLSFILELPWKVCTLSESSTQM
jgi:hypothetical protein